MNLRKKYYSISPSPYSTVFLGKFLIPNSQKPKHTYVKHPIEWLILEVDSQNQRALLLSKYILDWEGHFSASWKNSTIREWLNKVFFNEYLSFEEQNRVIPIDNTPSGLLERKSQDIVVDRVFLLSVKEIERYFDTRESAIALQPMIDWNSIGDKDEPIAIEYYPNEWWTRDTGDSKSIAMMCVDCEGELGEAEPDCNEFGVRPAMWIKF